jgi:flagellar hook-associated protein 3 FlgL
VIRGIDSSAEQFLIGIDRIGQRLDRVQRQISSGRRIETASDDPDQIGNLLRTRAELAQDDQVRNDLGSHKLEADLAADALTRTSQLLERVKSLSAWGITGPLDPSTTASLLAQVDGFMQEMVGIAGTTVNGRRIFSGDADQTAPYTLDPTQPNGFSIYAGSSTTRMAMHPDGTLFPVSQTADELFDSPVPGESVFGAIANLRQGIATADTTLIQDALDSVQSATDHIRTSAVFYGRVQSRISTATDYAGQNDVRLRDQLSSIQDVDMTAAIVELKDLQFNRDASLAARARVPNTSLFDYLG